MRLDFHPLPEAVHEWIEDTDRPCARPVEVGRVARLEANRWRTFNLTHRSNQARTRCIGPQPATNDGMQPFAHFKEQHLRRNTGELLTTDEHACCGLVNLHIENQGRAEPPHTSSHDESCLQHPSDFCQALVNKAGHLLWRHQFNHRLASHDPESAANFRDHDLTCGVRENGQFVWCDRLVGRVNLEDCKEVRRLRRAC